MFSVVLFILLAASAHTAVLGHAVFGAEEFSSRTLIGASQQAPENLSSGDAICQIEFCSTCTETEAKCTTPNLTRHFFDSLSASITTLKVIFNPAGPYSESITTEMIGKFSHLEKLYLAGRISSIEFGALNNMIKLKHVLLSNTAIKYLPANLFQHCKYLRTLEMRNIHLKTLPFDTLPPIDHGFKLILENVPALPIDIVCQNNSLHGRESGYVSYSNITSMSLVGLRINPINCTESKLSANFFALFTSLKKLDISNSDFLANDSTLLSQLPVLTTLIANRLIPFNECPANAGKFFNSLPDTLRNVTFTFWENLMPINQSCQFNKTVLSHLARLSSLERLIIYNNNLVFGISLDVEILPRIPNLGVLNLAFCGISWFSNLDMLHLRLPALETLILDGNFVGSRQRNKKTNNSPILNLYWSEMAIWSTVLTDYDLAPLLDAFPGLRFLNISNNYLKRPPIYSSNASKTDGQLRTLIADKNELLSTSTLLTNNQGSLCRKFPNLTSISFAKNLLRQLDGMCEQVTHLSLAENFLTNSSSTTDVLKKLIHLEVLDLSKNRFMEVSSFLDRLTSLKELDLGGNSIYTLPNDIFKRNLQLQKIFLWSNQITTVQGEMFQKLQNLEVLDLRNNEISIFPKDLLYQYIGKATHLKYVYFDENPIDCKCSQKYFQKWVSSTNKMKHASRKHLRCSVPPNQSGQLVLTYTDDYFECKIQQPLIIGGSILAAAVAAALIAIPCYKYFWFIKHLKIVGRAVVEDLKSIKQEYTCKYSAYVSYNREDEEDSEWVVNHLIPAVEGYHADSFSKQSELSLYVEGRDAGCGTLEFTEKMKVLQQCNKIVIVVSNSYLKSADCLGEADLAGLEDKGCGGNESRAAFACFAAGREMYGTDFYQPNRVLVLVREELTEEVIKLPMTALMEGKVIEMNHANERKVRAMWRSIRRFLSTSKHLYLKRKDSQPNSGPYRQLSESEGSDIENN